MQYMITVLLSQSLYNFITNYINLIANYKQIIFYSRNVI